MYINSRGKTFCWALKCTLCGHADMEEEPLWVNVQCEREQGRGRDP